MRKQKWWPVAAVLLALPFTVFSYAVELVGGRLDWGKKVYARLVTYEEDDEEAGLEEAAKAGGTSASSTGQDDGLPPVIGGRVDRADDEYAAGPERPGDPSDDDERISSMTYFDFRQATTDMLAQASAADITGMMQVVHSVDTMPEAVKNIAMTFFTVGQKLSPTEAALDASIEAKLEEMYQLFASGIGLATELGMLLRTHHAPEIERNENPRVNEHTWDVQSNPN